MLSRSLVCRRLIAVPKAFNVAQCIPVSRVTNRSYAQSWDGRNPNEKVEAHLKVQKLMDDIHSHPKVMEKLNVVSEIMISKGLASENPTKPLGPWQMIKILMDKDLKKAMNEFKSELENAGINLGPDQLGPLMTVLGIEKKSKDE